jgi:hypothetical protein
MNEDNKNIPNASCFQNEDLFNAQFVYKTFVIYHAELEEEQQILKEAYDKQEAQLRQREEAKKHRTKDN